MINKILSLGKWVFVIPFAVFSIKHIMNAHEMVGQVPAFFSGGVFWIYLVHIAQLLFAVSVVVGKYDKLAAALCALMLIIFVLTLHFPGLSNLQLSNIAFNNLLKDIGLAGGAMMYAEKFAVDKRVIG